MEITYHNKKEKQIKTIYYSPVMEHFEMKWITENTLSNQNNAAAYPDSDRSINLKVEQEIYHHNGLACQSLLMRNEYENCYQH